MSRRGRVTGGAPNVIEENFDDGSRKKLSEYSMTDRRSAIDNLLQRGTSI